MINSWNADRELKHIRLIDVSVHGELETVRHNSLSGHLHTFHDQDTNSSYLIINKYHTYLKYFISFQIPTTEVMVYYFCMVLVCVYDVSLPCHTKCSRYSNINLLSFKILRFTRKFLPSQMLSELKL